MSRQENDGDGGAGEKKERNYKSGEEEQNRVKWRRIIRNIDPHINVGQDVEEEIVHLPVACCSRDRTSFWVATETSSLESKPTNDMRTW